MATSIRESGVVITEVPNPSLNVGPGSVNITGIVGTGSSTIDVQNVQVIKGVTNGADTLPSTLSGQVQSIIGVGDTPGYFNYISGADYSQVDNTLQWLGAKQPTSGAAYFASYKKVKGTEFYQPATYFSIDDVRTTCGPELNNGVISEITLAANLVFQAGGDGTIVVVCQAVDGTTSGYIDALALMEKEEIDTLIVPGATNTAVLSAVIDHVGRMSTDYNQKERHAWVASSNLNDTVQTIGTLAASINSDRINLIAPPSVGITIRDIGTNVDTRLVLSSIYGGAALAGVETANDVATPLLRKRLPAMVDVNSFKYIRSEVLYMLGSGVTILQQDASGTYVKEASTTAPASIETVEPSIRRIKDLLRKQVRETLNTRYIGTKLLGGSLSNIEASTQAILTNFINSTLITAFRNISAKLDSVDPRQVNVSFEISPVFPLRFIQVTFSIFVNNQLG